MQEQSPRQGTGPPKTTLWSHQGAGGAGGTSWPWGVQRPCGQGSGDPGVQVGIWSPGSCRSDGDAPWDSVACPGVRWDGAHRFGTHSLLLLCCFHSLTKAERAQWQSDLLRRSLAGPEETGLGRGVPGRGTVCVRRLKRANSTGTLIFGASDLNRQQAQCTPITCS